MTIQILLRSVFVFFLLAAGAQAQRPPRINSPEVHDDGRITFRLLGPELKEVMLAAPWAGDPKPMTKGDDGLWSITIGPIEPDVLSYHYKIDGVQTVDPHNPRVKLWDGGAASLVEVPAAGGTFYDAKDVPHGDVHIHRYQSKSLGIARRVYVYTPPGYTAEKSRTYPALYLFHGSGDNESTWTELGYANLILDNLIAEGKAAPMVIVMPNGHPVPRGGGGPQSFRKNGAAFRRDVVEDLVPLIESRYRVKKDRRQRAITGLSMGGMQSVDVGLGHADLFSQVGSFSSAVFQPENDPTLTAFAADPDKANRDVPLLWIAIGKKDFLLKPNEAFIAFLTEKGINHTFRLTEGDHSWPVWRRYLREFVPLLFQQK
ncbi:MAG: esterase [bacterium]|nr:esterase [bacterium]